MSIVSAVDQVGGIPVIRVRGEVDLAPAPELASTLWRVITEGHPVIEVDVQGVTFMSCSGISVLVAAQQLASPRGQRVLVVRPSRLARKVFALGGVLQLVDEASEACPA